MHDVFVAAGSNVQPEKYLCRALQALAADFAPLKVSPAYRNKAVGFEGDDFINLVVGFSTTLSVGELRQRLQAIETLCGRPAPKWASRSMDLDILLYGAVVSSEPGLVLPRPDLVRRPYMLKPMVDIAPDVLHPVLHRTMRELWQAFDAEAHPMTPVALPEDCFTSPRSDRHRPPESGR